MDLEKISGLVKILEDSSLTELTLKEGDFKIHLSKLEHPPVISGAAPVAFAPGAGAAAAGPPRGAAGPVSGLPGAAGGSGYPVHRR